MYPHHLSAYAESLPEILRSATSAVVSLGLVSDIWFTLAPIFGLTVLGTRRSSPDYYSYPYSYDYSDGAGYQYDSQYWAQGRSLEVGEEGMGVAGWMARKLEARSGGRVEQRCRADRNRAEGQGG